MAILQCNGLVTLTSQEWEILKIGSIYKGTQEFNSKTTEHNIVVLVEWAPKNNRFAPYIDNKQQIRHELGVHIDYNLDMYFQWQGCVCVGGSQDINHISDMLVYLHA